MAPGPAAPPDHVLPAQRASDATFHLFAADPPPMSVTPTTPTRPSASSGSRGRTSSAAIGAGAIGDGLSLTALLWVLAAVARDDGGPAPWEDGG